MYMLMEVKHIHGGVFIKVEVKKLLIEVMIYLLCKISKLAGLLMISCLLWVTFAG